MNAPFSVWLLVKKTYLMGKYGKFFGKIFILPNNFVRAQMDVHGGISKN